MNRSHPETFVLAIILAAGILWTGLLVDCRLDDLEDFHEPTQDGEGL